MLAIVFIFARASLFPNNDNDIRYLVIIELPYVRRDAGHGFLTLTVDRDIACRALPAISLVALGARRLFDRASIDRHR